MEFGFLLMYSELFGKRSIPDLDVFIKKRCNRLTLEWICHALGILHHYPTQREKQKELLNMLLPQQPEWYKYAVYSQLSRLSKNNDVLIFDKYILLQLLCKIIRYYDPNLPLNDTIEQHRFIFEAVILANEEVNAVGIIKTNDKLEKFCALTWPHFTKSTYYRIRRDLLGTVSHSLELIGYLVSVPKFRDSIKEWSWLKEPTNLEDYFVHVLSLYLRSWNKKREHQNYRISFDLHSQYPWTKQITLDLRSGPPSNFDPIEFRTLRSKPILQIDNNVYIFSNHDFVLDKLGIGLVFDVFNNTSLKDKYRDSKGQPRFDSFKGDIGYHFAERYMSKIIQGSISLKMDAFITGDPNKPNNVDFYFRRGNHICLCEFKDALAIKAGSYEDIRKQLDNKIGGDKGIGQLVKLINKLQDDTDVFEAEMSKHINKRRIDVYPVILVYDTAFSMPGMNDYLNRNFRRMLPKTDFYVHDLVVINVDYLVTNYDNFLQSREDLFTMLQKYYVTKFRLRKQSYKPKNYVDVFKQFDAFSEINKFRHHVSKKAALRNHMSLFNKVRKELTWLFPEKLPGNNPEQS